MLYYVNAEESFVILTRPDTRKRNGKLVTLIKQCFYCTKNPETLVAGRHEINKTLTKKNQKAYWLIIEAYRHSQNSKEVA